MAIIASNVLSSNEIRLIMCFNNDIFGDSEYVAGIEKKLDEIVL